MTLLYWNLFLLGIGELFLTLFLGIRFADRCGLLSLFRVRHITSADEYAFDPYTDPLSIRLDAKKWFPLPVCSFLVVAVIALFGDWQTQLDRQHITPALLIFVEHGVVGIFGLVVFLPAFRFNADRSRPE